MIKSIFRKIAMFVPKIKDGGRHYLTGYDRNLGLTWPRALKMERRMDRSTDISNNKKVTCRPD